MHDPIFHQEIVVFCNQTEKDLLDWQRRLGVSEGENRGLNPNYNAFSTHYSAEGEPNIYLIWLNRFDWTLNDQATLIHEIVHTVVRIWEQNNIKFVPETQEFYAHSVDGLYSLIATKILIRKEKRGQKKNGKSSSPKGRSKK